RPLDQPGDGRHLPLRPREYGRGRPRHGPPPPPRLVAPRRSRDAPRSPHAEEAMYMTFDPRHKSRVLLDGADRAAARSYFRAVGFTDEDLARPLVGIAHCWIELTPCNANHRKLAQKVAEGVRANGGTPIEFNTISVTDGIAMGTEGMKASLISRDWIADS